MHSLNELIDLNDSVLETSVVNPDLDAQFENYNADLNKQYATLINRLLGNGTIEAVYQGPERNELNFGQTGEVYDLQSDKQWCWFRPHDDGVGRFVRACEIWVPHFQRTLNQIIQGE